MGIMITYDGYNNPVYDAHKNVGAHYIWQNTVHGFRSRGGLLSGLVRSLEGIHGKFRGREAWERRMWLDLQEWRGATYT